MKIRKYIRSNQLYAIGIHLVRWGLYVAIGVVALKIVENIIGFEMLPFILEQYSFLDLDISAVIIEHLVAEVAISLILILVPTVLFIIKTARQDIEVCEDHLLVRHGLLKKKFIKVPAQEFVRYKIKKDFGLDMGIVTIETEKGDDLTLPYVLGLDSVKSAFDRILRIKAEHKTTQLKDIPDDAKQ